MKTMERYIPEWIFVVLIKKRKHIQSSFFPKILATHVIYDLIESFPHEQRQCVFIYKIITIIIQNVHRSPYLVGFSILRPKTVIIVQFKVLNKATHNGEVEFLTLRAFNWQHINILMLIEWLTNYTLYSYLSRFTIHFGYCLYNCLQQIVFCLKIFCLMYRISICIKYEMKQQIWLSN